MRDDGNGARRTLRRQQDERTLNASLNGVVGGVRSLRNELNAALLDQQYQHAALLRRYTRRSASTASPTSSHGLLAVTETLDPGSSTTMKVPAWSDLDASLASLKFQSCSAALWSTSLPKTSQTKRSSGHQPRHLPQPLRTVVPDQVVQSAQCGSRRPPDGTATRLAISSKYLTLWRELAHTMLVVRQFSRRRASRLCDLMLRHTFHAWQLHWRQQQSLNLAYRAVATVSNALLVIETYQRWRRSFRFKRGYRALNESRREHLLRAGFRHWQSHAQLRRRVIQCRGRSRLRVTSSFWQRWHQYAHARRQRTSQDAVARSHLLKNQWDKLVRRVQRRIDVRALVKRHLRKHRKRFLDAHFGGWLEFLEWKKRCQFGVKWYNQRLLDATLIKWKTVRDCARVMAKLEKRAHKKMSRFRLQRYLQQWRSTARYLRHRAVQLKVSNVIPKEAVLNLTIVSCRTMQQITNRLALRIAFGHFYRLSMILLGSEREFQSWKCRRTLRTWLQRSDERKHITLRGLEVARVHSMFVKRAHGWVLWCMAYRRRAGTRALAERRCWREIRRVWDALSAVSTVRRRLRSLTTLASSRIASRRLGLAVSAWADFTYASQVHRDWTQQSSRLCDRALKKRSLMAWSRWRIGKRRLRAISASADGFLLKHAVRRWRCRADRLHWERLARQANADRFREKSLARKCMAIWSLHAQQQRRQQRWRVFNAWCRFVRYEKACRAFVAVARPLKLRHQWHRWLKFVRYKVELRERGQQVSLKHERSLKHSFFVEKWLSKIRRYHCARLLIGALDRTAAQQRAFALWKLWAAHQMKTRRAIEYAGCALKRRCLLNMYVATIGQTQLADSYCKHHQLIQAWRAWLIRCSQSKLIQVAGYRFRQFRLYNALSCLQSSTRRDQQMKAYQQRADRWRRDVLLETGFGHWYFAARKLIRVRRAQKQVRWRCMVAKHFQTWRFMRAVQQKTRKAGEFHRRVRLKRGFDLWLQITKRRLVAVAMWRYAMARIRSAQALATWVTYISSRRRVILGVDALYRRRYRRVLRRCFSQWELVVAVEVSRSMCLHRCTVRWLGQCLTHWKRFLSIKHMHYKRCRETLRSSFARLRRFAAWQQAERLLHQRSGRAALDRALHAWQIELRMAQAQRTAAKTLLQYYLREWGRYASACRQQRQWIHYAQQLRRIHETTSEAGAVKELRQAAALHDTLGYQSCKRDNRVTRRYLQRQVLHAWYLAAKCSQRCRRRDLLASPSLAPRNSATLKLTDTARSKYLLPVKTQTRTRRRAHDRSNRVLALRFWADHLVSRAFGAWKKHFNGQRSMQLRRMTFSGG